MLSARNVREGFIALDDVDYVDEEEYLRISKRCNPQRGDVLISCSGSIGRVAVVSDDNKYVMVRSAAMVSPIEVESRYIEVALQSPLLQTQMNIASKQIAQANLFQGAISQLLMPIPPLTEQLRIVHQFDCLRPYLNHYETLESQRNHLDAELPERLRKSILQLAVQGKLVEQDPADEPASALLDRIRTERAALVKAKKLKAPKGGESIIYRASYGGYYEKRGKGEVVCIDGEIPFEIPESWEWVRLGDIGDWKAGATPAKGESKYYSNGTIPWLLTGDLTDGPVTEIPNSITEQALRQCSVRLNPVGSVLVAMYGATIGKIGVLGVAAATNQACCACVLHDESIREWLVTWLRYQKPHFIKMGEGGAQPNISRQKIVGCLLPLPPLEEQQRIVDSCKALLSVLV